MLKRVRQLDDTDHPLMLIMKHSLLVAPFTRIILNIVKQGLPHVDTVFVSLESVGINLGHVRHLVRPHGYPIAYPSDVAREDMILLRSPVVVPFYMVLVKEESDGQAQED